MNLSRISVDFSHTLGEIKPLHGVNNSPISLYEPPLGFKEAGIPFCRLHDACGAYGGAHYVDIPNIFPNFDADPADPASYDFAFTDAYLKQLNAAGAQIFYRLGITIENNYKIKGYHNHPPKDFAKWAEICAGVVRHYNCGWANGLHLGIQYWEIWNEPENPPMWSGTMEQYFELYRTTSLRLKKEFPDIHVGGYASCGFYAVTGDRTTEFYKSFVTWFHDFLQFVTDSKTQCPFDFFSWHLYTGIPEKIVAHANYVDAKLKEFGLDKTENIFNEWNYTSKNPQRRFLEMKDNEGASFVSAAFCLMQPSPIDKAMYYDAYPQRSYCGLYHFPGRRTTQTYTAFKMWNQLYRLGKQCATASDQKSLYSCAAANKGQKALLITNFSSKGCRLSIQMKGAKLKDFSARIIDRRHDGAPFALTEEIALPPYSTLLLTTQQSEMQALPSSKSPTNHAGLASN